MNCPRCNAPLATNARFCATCGLPISSGPSNPINAEPVQPYSSSPRYDAPTVPVPPWQAQPPQSPPVPSSPVPNYQPARSVEPGTLGSANPRAFSNIRESPPRRRRRGGCFARTLLSLIILLVLSGGLWFLLLRPYLHSRVQSQTDQVLTAAVNQINPLGGVPIGGGQLPPGIVVPITETLIDNLFVLNTAPSDPVQNQQVHISPSGLRLDFQAYGFHCAMTGVPQLVNGKLVFNNVTVEGIVALIMSPDEIQATLNRHLADVQQRLNRPIQSVSLNEQELDLKLG